MANCKFEFKSIAELKDYKFWISSLQRGYKWTPTNAIKLVEDFCDFLTTGKDNQAYCLQPLAVCKKNELFDVLDGQQRLTTLYLLIKCLFNEEWYTMDFDRDNEHSSRSSFLKTIGTTNINTDELDIDQFYITNVYNCLLRWVNDKNKEYIENLKAIIKDKDTKNRHIFFMWYEIPETERHQVFGTLNNGKVELTNSDLIKALLLSDTHKDETYDISKIATQFNEIEQFLENDQFWFMLQNSLPEYNECRMDLIFNIASEVSPKDYKTNPKASFDKIVEKKDDIELLKYWDVVRDTFIRIVDLYEDPYSYHYIGFLTYCGKQSKINDILKMSKSKSLTEFHNSLKEDYIKPIVNCDKHSKLSDYSYEIEKKDLRQLFLLHNIESILQTYSNMYKDKMKVDLSFERFPFDLLYKQSWDIEHIASQTDNPMEKNTDQDDWVQSLQEDEPEIFNIQNVNDAYTSYISDPKNDKFKTLYNLVLNLIDKKLEDQKVENKDGIGNLVLLDSKTNRGYHNSLFPRKRRFIIENSFKYYIPTCTKNVFMKFYNKNISIRTNAWTKDDYECYEQNLKDVLNFYFD